MSRIQKILMMGLLLLSGLFLLCSCMTEEDKQLAAENVRIGTPMVSSYVETNYGEEAEITEIECLNLKKESGPVPDFYDHPSNYVEATVHVGNEEFKVLVNVETKQGYDNRYMRQIKESVLPFISSRISMPSPRSLELHYRLDELSVLSDSNRDGYAYPNTTSLSEMLSDGKYETDLLFRYVSTDLSSLKGQEEQLFSKEENTGAVTVGFVSFREESDYISLQETPLADQNIDASVCSYNDLIEQAYIAERYVVYNLETDQSDYNEVPIVTYHRFDCVSLNQQMKLVYDEECYEIDVKRVDAESPVRVRNKQFETADGDVFELDIVRKVDSDEGECGVSSEIDLYFDQSCEGQYLVSSQDGEDDWNRIGWDRRDGFYYFFYTHDPQSSLRFGLYHEIDEDSSSNER
jgi:hypothetical protein